MEGNPTFDLSSRRPPVVVALPLEEHYLDRLRQHCDVTCMSRESDPQAFDTMVTSTAEGLLLSTDTHLGGDLLRRTTRLRVISTASVGLDHIDLAAAVERGITVTIAAVLSDDVADLVMALILMLARRLPAAVHAAKTEEWDDPPIGHSLAGKLLLLVGFGRIGQEVAKRALASKMEVRYVDRRDDLPSLGGLVAATNLRTGLAEADVVSLHVDLNASTRHLIGADELRLVKPTALLVNTSRGGVIDQTALRQALAENRLAGAGLDVLEPEPPAPNEPLLSDSRVVVLPHIGSGTTETRTAMMEVAVDNLIACLRGDPCRYIVGPDARTEALESEPARPPPPGR
jgi:glyoxylate reductase